MTTPGSRIQSAIKQRRPFSSLAHAAAVALQRVAGHHRDELAERLRPAGLSLTQFNVLRILRGVDGGGLPCGEISSRLVTRDPDMTRLLDRLEQQGLVARSRTTADRRVVTTRITEAGLEAIAALDESVEALHVAQLGGMGRSRLKVLLALLEDLDAGTGRPTAPGTRRRARPSAPRTTQEESRREPGQHRKG